MMRLHATLLLFAMVMTVTRPELVLLNVSDGTSPITFTSPGYESGKYPEQMEMYWELHAASNAKKLHMVFEDFDVEYHPSCRWDNVKISEHTCADDAIEYQTTLCGKRPFYKFNSTGKTLCVHFKSDQVVTRRGFKALVSVINDEKLDVNVESSTTSDIENHTTAGSPGLVTEVTASPEATLPINTTSTSVTPNNPVISPSISSASSSSSTTTTPTTASSSSLSTTTTTTSTSLTTSTATTKSQSATTSTRTPSSSSITAAQITASHSTSPPSSSPQSSPSSSSSSLPPTTSSSSSPPSTPPSIASTPLSSEEGEVDTESSILPQINVTMCETTETDHDLKDIAYIIIRSPKDTSGQYPGKYPVNRHCSLTLENVLGLEVHIQFLQFNIEKHPSCIWDFVMLTFSPNSTGKMCGYTVPVAMTTTSNTIEMIFHSDHVVPSDGFTVKIYSIKGGSASETTNMPPTVPHTTAPKTPSVTSTIPPVTSSVTVEPPAGSSANPPGSSSTSEPSFNQNTTSAESITATSQQSGTVSNTTEEQVTSTNPPGLSSTSEPFFNQNTTSAESITATSQQSGTVSNTTEEQVTSTNTTTSPDQDDNIQRSTVSTKPSNEGTFAPPESTSTSNEEQTTSTSDALATISTTTPTLSTTAASSLATNDQIIDICHVQQLQMFTKLSIVTPGYLEQQYYPLSTDCSIEIVSPPGKEVIMTIQDFELELNSGCHWDHLTLEQASGSTRFCGYLDKWQTYTPYSSCSPNYIRTVEEESDILKCVLQTGTQLKLESISPIRLKFHSDEYVRKRGFNISLAVVDVEIPTTEGTTLPATTTSPSSSTASPQPSSTFPSDTINPTSTSGQSSEGTTDGGIKSPVSTTPIATSTTEHTDDEPPSFEQVSPGTEEPSKDTSNQPSPIVTNTFVIEQTTSKPLSINSSSTTVNQTSASTTTEQISHTSSTLLASSSTTAVLPTSSNTSTVSLSPTFEAATTTSPPSVSSTSSLPSSTSSSSSSATPLTSTPLLTTTTLPEQISACSGNGEPLLITDHTGYIESPGFQQQQLYPPNSHCKWRVRDNKNRVIVIIFESFNIEDSTGCVWDKLAFYTLNDDGNVNKTLKVLCGDGLQVSLQSADDLLIEFISDGIQQRSGFRLKYLKTEAGNIGNRACPFGKTACVGSGDCIPAEWWCDGIADCADESDEKHCVTCTENEFSCGDGICISRSLRCDGHAHCDYNTDETGCVSTTEVDEMSLRVEVEGQGLSLCYNSTVITTADQICRKAGFRSSASVWAEESHEPNAEFAAVAEDDTGKLSFIKSENCDDNLATFLTCSGSTCGMKSPSYRKKRIIGGSVSSKGEWPWSVALRVGNSVICGATILSDMWVITAGHCVNNLYTNPQVLSILAGVNDINDGSGQIIYVSELAMHPNYNFIFNADVALLRLQRPLQFSDDVKPICLPWDQRQFSPSATCFVAGYGVSDMKDYYYSTLSPNFLRHVRTKIVDHDTCRDTYSYKTYVEDSMICAGYVSGGMDACKGDSGGALMCEADDGRWVLAGVVSWGDMCGTTARPGVYTRVTSFMDWIDQSTRIADSQTVNCSFEGDWCGYTDMSSDKYFWTRKPGDKYVKGMIMYASRSPTNSAYQPANATLTTPDFTNSFDSCLSFQFLFTSNSNVTLSVMGVNDVTGGNDDDGVTELLWQMPSNYPSKDTWISTEVMVPANIIRLKFVSLHEQGGIFGVGLDNVSLAGSRCSGSDFMWCSFNDGDSTCMYTMSTETYSMAWRFEQSETDNTDYYLTAGGEYNEFGYMAVSQLVSPPVSVTFMSIPHCVNFKFKIFTEAEAELVLATYISIGGLLNNQVIYWKSVEVTVGEWRTASVTIKNDYFNHIVFEVRRKSYDLDDIRIGIDDINVSDGVCV